MPSRILRDCCDSEAVNSLSAEAERHFYRLIMKVDDYGRLAANPKVLRPLLYPLLLDQVREANVERWNAECVRARLVRLYAVEGKQYLSVNRFNQRTRSASKYPDPPIEDSPHSGGDDGRGSCPVADGNATGGCQTNDGQLTVNCQTSDGHMTDKCPPNADAYSEAHAQAQDGGKPPWECFWEKYPQVGRDRSSRKLVREWWEKKKLTPITAEVLASLERWKQSAEWAKKGGQFVLGAHRWIKEEKWRDPPATGGLELDESRDSPGFERVPVTPELIRIAMGQKEDHP